MTTAPILDDLFNAIAFTAFVTEARAVQGWPDPEKTRQRAYRLYEEELARPCRAGAGRIPASAVNSASSSRLLPTSILTGSGFLGKSWIKSTPVAG